MKEKNWLGCFVFQLYLKGRYHKRYSCAKWEEPEVFNTLHTSSLTYLDDLHTTVAAGFS